ncbi:MAG: hypothetical protein HZB16_18290 [Armatimonadetes bacterium]|nr:hypothetical protein [Armatimonadota bacterium]
MARKTLFLLAALLTTSAWAQLDPADFVAVSGPSSPRVAFALNRTDDRLQVFVEVGAWSSTLRDCAVDLALAAAKPVRLTSDGARSAATAEGRRFAFAVPAGQLVGAPADWGQLRLALAVRWLGTGGAEVQRERFRCLDGRAPHAPLPDEPALWAPLSLVEYERLAADRRQALAVRFTQPFDGKATLVIEDSAGRRVRNLVSGETTAKGAQSAAWDGLDDDGRPVPPGAYRWRSAYHPGLRPTHLFSFCDGPGSNHGTLESAATNGQVVVFGTGVSEGGYEIVALEPDGRLRMGFNAPNGHGLERLGVAVDARYVYAVYDGMYWGQRVDRSKPGWSATYQIGLVRFDLATGQTADYDKGVRLSILSKYETGPGSPDKRADRPVLGGVALLGGRLYVADGSTDTVLVVDPATGLKTGALPLREPGALAAAGDALLAVSAGALVRVDPASGKATPILPAGDLRITGLAVDPAGRILLSDGASQTVRFLSATGQPAGTVGKPGGPYTGAYDPQRMIHPAGLVLGPNGWLWVTEPGRWTPKRLAAYDPASGAVKAELYGPTAYGAPGAGFDPADATRWFGQGSLFRLDFAAKKAVPAALTGGQPGMHYRYWRQDGRTFVIAYGKATYIEELRADGSLKPLACLTSAHQFSYSRDWNPPAAFVEAFAKAYPNEKYVVGTEGRPQHGFGMIWVDRSGDGEMQADEIQFATSAANLAGSGWGHDLADLTLRVAATVGGGCRLVTLKPSGFWPGGAPKYPDLNEAIAAAPAIDLPTGGNMVESTVDRFGTTILNSDPVMRAYAPDGTLKWRYPNRWTNVHGSHNAPLPRTGELQGVLFFTGVAPLDAQGDVMVMNGNHGRLFAMTTDGLYLDEMFSDVRVGGPRDAYMIGGECFGGCFGRSEKDGTYYLQAGGIEYRVFRVDGLGQVKRDGGTLTVTAAQAAAAERNLARRVADAAPPKVALAPRLAAPPKIDGDAGDWPAEGAVKWDKSGQVPVTVRAGYDDQNLYLHYQVRDDSPWVNRGKDWQTLFKTGDSVDLQLGLDDKAPADRTGPVPGDLRLLIAPMGEETVTVLYRHRLAKPVAAESVVFQSPWRAEKVDSVKRLGEARVVVLKAGDGYRLEAAIPWSALGAVPVGRSVRADFGVIYGDTEGTINRLRNYWSNQATMLVNDVPGEIMLTPRLWGTLRFEEAGR